MGLPEPFKWIDYTGTNLDSGRRNLPDLPDELETDSRNEISVETDDIRGSAKVSDIQTISPLDTDEGEDNEDTPEKKSNNQNSLYEFEGTGKAEKHNVNDCYDYEMNVDDGEDVLSDN